MPTVAITKPPQTAALKDLYELDEVAAARPCPGADVRLGDPRERHGPPQESFQVEVVPTWSIGEEEVLLLVMAGGVNYNGIWAGLGQPISPFDVHKDPFHVAGSDASGIVWAVRLQGEALEGRRRGHRPLQPGRRRRRGVQWRRPDVLAHRSASGATRRRTAPSRSSAGCSRASSC